MKRGKHYPDNVEKRLRVGDIEARPPHPESPRGRLGDEKAQELWERNRYWIYNCKAACDLEFRVYSWFDDLNAETWRCPMHQDPILIVRLEERRGAIHNQTTEGRVIFERAPED